MKYNISGEEFGSITLEASTGINALHEASKITGIPIDELSVETSEFQN